MRCPATVASSGIGGVRRIAGQSGGQGLGESGMVDLSQQLAEVGWTAGVRRFRAG
jgi:hypothetical protein